MNLVPRLRHGGVVALLAVGLLTMHGLTAAGSTVEEPGHGTESVAVTTGHGVHASLDHTMGGSGHDVLHDIGHACLWLLAGSALLVAARRMGATTITRVASTRDLRPSAWVRGFPLLHPPNAELATVVLRH